MTHFNPDQSQRRSKAGCVCASRCSSGYALLLTLVMLVLTAVTISTLAHTSSTQAMRARQAERDLQSRWAETSCRRVLMPALQQHLQTALDSYRDAGAEWVDSPPSSVAVSFALSGVQVVARLDDQQAVPNVNHLLTSTTQGQPNSIADVLIPGSIRARLVPRPLDESQAQQLNASPFESWGQLYPTASPQALSGMTGSMPLGRGLVLGYADRGNGLVGAAPGGSGVPGIPGVGLWGDGRLNVWTASPQSLHRVLDDGIGSDQVAKLLALRRDHRELSARQLVQAMNLGPSERAVARQTLTDRSRTFGMWLAVTPTDVDRPLQGRQAHWSLTIVESSDRSARSGGSHARVFRW